VALAFVAAVGGVLVRYALHADLLSEAEATARREADRAGPDPGEIAGASVVGPLDR
jgi:hypothetical protein